MRREDWIRLLEHHGDPAPTALPPDPTLVSGTVLGGTPVGHTREGDMREGDVREGVVREGELRGVGTRGEQILWRACAGEPLDPSSGITGASGPLLKPDAYLAIEVWAECELSAVHALFRLVRERRSPAPDSTRADPGSLDVRPHQDVDWNLKPILTHALTHNLTHNLTNNLDDTLERRLAEAVRWHLEHTQPDNSTNRPWALHAFLLADDGSGDAALYAETLLHNTLATDARREPLSRWILADAARELRLAATERP